MSGAEKKLHDAFDALTLSRNLAESTLARIEAVRAEEERAAAEQATAEQAATGQAAAEQAATEQAAAERAGSYEHVTALRSAAADEAPARSIGTPADASTGAGAAGAAPKPHPALKPRSAPSFQPRVVSGGKKRTPLFARRSFRFAVAACLCAALVCGGGTVVYASESAAVEISTDAVASTAGDDASLPVQGGAASEAAIELGVNRFNIVVRATGLNEAGEALLQSASVVGKSYEDAASLIMGQDAIGQDGYVNVTVSGGNAGQCDYLNQTSETCLGHRAEGSYACDHASVEERQAAQDAGMGTARYQAYLELSALDPSVTADLCHGLTLAELRWMVNALQSGEASTAQEALEQARAAGVGTGHHAESAGHHGQGADAGAGNGSGYGSGSGNGSGSGSGNGAGDGSGAGEGNGSGNGASAGSAGSGASGAGATGGQGAGAGHGSGNGGGHGAGHGRGAE